MLIKSRTEYDRALEAFRHLVRVNPSMEIREFDKGAHREAVIAFIAEKSQVVNMGMSWMPLVVGLDYEFRATPCEVGGRIMLSLHVRTAVETPRRLLTLVPNMEVTGEPV